MKKLVLPILMVLGAIDYASAQNKRYSLMEEFSGENCGPCASLNPAFWTKITATGNDEKVLLIKYQSPIPSAGPIYNENKVFTNARMTYYSVPFAPYARLNGANVGSDGNIANLTQAMINDAYAKETPFIVKVGKPVYDATRNNEFTIEVEVTASSKTSASGSKVRLAIAETLKFDKAPGTNGEKEFHNVVRQMFPNADGISLDSEWSEGQTRKYTFKGVLPSYLTSTKDNFFVAWLQNESTKEVLQTGVLKSPEIKKPESAVQLVSANAGNSLYCSTPAVVTGHSVKVKNTGTVALTKATFYYRADATAAWSTFDWTGSIAAGAEKDIALPDVSLDKTGYVAIYDSVGMPNGFVDYNDYDNATSKAISVVSNAKNTLPIFTDFESGTENYVPFATGSYGYPFFIYNSGSANYGYDASKYFLYYPINSFVSGVNGYNILPYADLSVTQKAIDLYVSYCQVSPSNNDKLELVYSTNCGENWNSVWSKSGTALATVAAKSSSYHYPTRNDQWRMESVDISSIPDGAIIAIKVTSDGGNTLFVDNVNIREGLPNSIQNIFAKSDLNVFPNPANNNLNVKFNTEATIKAQVLVHNAVGQVVINKDYTFNKGENNYNLNISNLPAGNYILSIQAENGKVENKFVKL